MQKTNKWTDRWFELVDLVASWSKDPSTKIGAVIIPEHSDSPVFGWNGFPRGVDDSAERYNDRETKYMLVTHAEANCILNAARNGVNINGATIYVSQPPCNECSKLIVQSGIKKVVHRPMTEDMKSRWEKVFTFSDLILSEGGVIKESYEIQEKEDQTS